MVSESNLVNWREYLMDNDELAESLKDKPTTRVPIVFCNYQNPETFISFDEKVEVSMVDGTNYMKIYHGKSDKTEYVNAYLSPENLVLFIKGFFGIKQE